MAKTLRAPFNFVPVSDKVYFPDWADQISHDIPFEDGNSGSIELKISAQSPIYIRNGHSKDDAKVENETYKSFSKAPDGRYFIPGSSLRGMFRSVLEIVSFGKMGKFEDRRFAYRDLKNKEGYRDKLNKIHIGWLYLKENETYKLEDCGLLAKPIANKGIDYSNKPKISEIDELLGGNELQTFVEGNNFKNDENKTAIKKYEIIYRKIKKLSTSDNVSIDELVKADDDLIMPRNGDNRYIVTGQPAQSGYDPNKINPNKSKGGYKSKFREYSFRINGYKTVPVPDSVFDDFEFIHQDSKDYAEFWRCRLISGKRIPVFFRYTNDDSINGMVESIGLTSMYKYPTAHSVHDGVSLDHLSYEYDMAECIFGSTSEQGLKGRVWIGHAFNDGTAKALPEVQATLGSPHASYYPLYVVKGNSWNSPEVKIAGRKRYIPRNGIVEKSGTETTSTKFRPLKEGTTFTCSIRYHNLKDAELGALLSAITFHNHIECFHSLGMAKPLGYGKIKVEITDDYTKKILQNKLEVFANILKQSIGEELTDSPQFRELSEMAKGIKSGRDEDFTYMHMSTKSAENEFGTGITAYRNGEQLGLFSEISSPTNITRIPCKQDASDIQRNNINATRDRRREYFKHLRQISQSLEKGDLENIEKEASEISRIGDSTLYKRLEPLIDAGIAKFESARKQAKEQARKEKAEQERRDQEEKVARAKQAEQEARQAMEALESQEKDKKYSVSFEEFLERQPNKTKLDVISLNVVKWAKYPGNELTDTAKSVLMGRIKSWYDSLKKYDKNQYMQENKWKTLYDLIGQEETHRWFVEITGINK